MTTSVGFPSGTNTFVPSFDASGKLQVEFSRNPKKFKINQYIKVKTVKKDVGYYLVITAEEAARVIGGVMNDFVWGDGQEAPMGDDNLESFSYSKYATLRYAFPFTLGNKAVEQADWEIVASHSRIAAQKAMTARTVKVLSVIAAANWPSSSTDTAVTASGGQFAASSDTTLYIKKSFRYMAEKILKNTIGVVQREDLIVVMNPTSGGIISESPELVSHLKNNVYGLAQIRQDAPNQNGQWGLPDVLYGTKVCIEDAVVTTSKKTAGGNTAPTRAYAFPDDELLVLSRPEGLMGSEGVPDFSTVQVFSYEDMTVETKKDPDNRREQGRVVDDYDVQIVAPAAGFRLTDIFA